MIEKNFSSKDIIVNIRRWIRQVIEFTWIQVE